MVLLYWKYYFERRSYLIEFIVDILSMIWCLPPEEVNSPAILKRK